MKRLLLLVVSLSLCQSVTSSAGYKAPRYCTPTQGSANWCGNQPGNGNGYTCLHWHSDEEFCKDENAPTQADTR
jgi:hypothetical protein